MFINLDTFKQRKTHQLGIEPRLTPRKRCCLNHLTIGATAYDKFNTIFVSHFDSLKY
ncbi:hypothetical protein AAJ76_7500017032 [Vairimorpha ceranae]|uniref:Uncharacterized protein n=1 Tax=Vairimorpha ceranae TaxID=40302 RepID=A0A0F9WC35_9MICR|nr:hypothetical protein AAJ76_7500017032 [Vairimorpha ceranae]KKO74400.1 hypothetical protein AAJ76_7500017032 [Vairimorpha ceranae]